MGEAVYIAATKIPHDCPPILDLDVPAGFHCHIVRGDDGALTLTLESASLPKEWDADSRLLSVADGEAERVVAVLCFRYAAPYGTPVRQRPVDPSLSGPWYYDMRCITFEDGWPEEEAALLELLQTHDPRAYRLWQVLASVGGLSDPLARFIALWGLLDIGLQAKNAAAIDHYLWQHFRVPRDCPDQDGIPNRHTKFTHLRHTISHPSGRDVADVTSLTDAARQLNSQLTDHCRQAVREGFVL